MANLIWSRPNDWQDAYYGLTRRGSGVPAGYRSHARAAWDEELQRALDREDAERAAAIAHVRDLHEHDEIEKWRGLVEQFGADAVETIVRRTDAAFALPKGLRGVAPSDGNLTQGEDDACD